MCIVWLLAPIQRHSRRAMATALKPDSFTPLRLRQQVKVGAFSRIFTFDLPSPKHTMGMHVGQYVSIRAKVNGEDVVRSYSPMSRITDHGQIQLLVKCEDAGHMSVCLANLRPGETIEFTGPLGTADLDPHKYTKMGLIAGGAGVSAVLQVPAPTLSAPLGGHLTPALFEQQRRPRARADVGQVTFVDRARGSARPLDHRADAPVRRRRGV